MIYHAIISAFLWLLLSSFAYANDPFSIIFGDEPIKASVTNDATNDTLTILRLRIRHHLISENWTAHELADGLCLPVQAFADALEFPLSIEDGTLRANILGQDKSIEINPLEGSGFVKIENGWCTFAEQLETIFPVKIDFRPANLELVVSPNLALPIDERLAREELRESLEDEKSGNAIEYRPVANPYRIFNLPTFDFTFDAAASSSNTQSATATISGAADLLWMNAHFQSSSSLEGAFETNRLRLFRHNGRPEELSFLKARRFAIGDVSSRSQPMISRSQSGRGFLVSNQPLFKPELFDETTIRGALPEGWEAELFDGEVLIAFLTDADRNGEYVFKDVPLRPGYNHLTVKLFGPYGETTERHITQFVGSEHCPEDEWRYSFGFVDPGHSFFGESLFEIGNEVEITPSNTPSAFLSLEHGISKDLTLLGDLNMNQEQILLSTSIISSVFDGYGVGRIALDETGGLGWQINYQKRLSPSTSFSSRVSDFGSLETNLNGFGDNRILRQISSRLDTRLKIGKSITPVQTEFSFNERENNLSEFNANLRVAGTFKRVKWSNSMRYNLLSQTDSSVQNLQGELLGSYSVSGIRLRGAFNYSVLDNLSLNSVSLSARKKIDKSSQIQAGVTYDLRSNNAAIEGSFSKSFDKISVQTKAKIDNAGEWSLGLGLSFSLYHDERQGKYKLGKPGLSRSGVIAPRIFDDLNNNGVFDAGDMPVEGAQFIVENSLRSEESDASGTNVIADLTPSKSINSEIKLSSIQDPFLRPMEIGRTVELRAGQVLGYDVPLTATGEIEGVMKVANKDLDIPVAGITIEAVNSKGQVVGSTQTEYDGYFYLQDVPAISLKLRVSEIDLESMDGYFQPLGISLSRKSPSRLGLSLTVKREGTGS